jgi:hypothetical protein
MPASRRDESQVGGSGLVALGTFMTTLDASIVNIGLPSIARTRGHGS